MTHGYTSPITHGYTSPVTHLNESHIEGEPEEREPLKESHADFVGSVASETGLDQVLSSSPEGTDEMLRNFSDEPASAQPSQPQSKPTKSKPRSNSQSKLKQELVDALAQVDLAIVEDLFMAWAETGKGKSHPSPERLGLIARALVDWGFPAEDVRDALTGWPNDPWEDRHLHKDVRVLLRDPSQVEKFRDLKRNPPAKKRDSGAGMRANVSDIQRYHDFDLSTAFGRKPKSESEVTTCP